MLLVVVSFGYGLSSYPLLDPDEGRNGEIAREMAESNDYILPRLNGLPYLDKPVLFFGTAALSIEIFGVNELAVRLPSLMFTVLTLLAVGFFAKRRFGTRGGLIAAAVTGSMPLTLGFARTVIFDAALAFFVVVAILALFEACESDSADSAYWWTVGAWTAVALGVLTKGPVAVALPLMVGLPYAFWRRRARRTLNLVSALTFFAILLPWLLAMSNRVPGFLEYAIVAETWERLTTDEMGRTGPLWYYIPILIAGALPWSLGAAAHTIRMIRERTWDNAFVLATLWIVAPLVFFSLSQSKRPQYLLPVMPAIGLLIARAWHESAARVPGRRTMALGLLILAAVFLVGSNGIGDAFGASQAVARSIPRTGLLLGAICLLTGGTMLIPQASRFAAVILCLPVASIPVVATPLMRAIGEDRSMKSVAAVIRSATPGGTEVVAVDVFPLSLPFYLERVILLSTTTGAELTSNYLFRTLDRWRSASGSTLQDPDRWREQLSSCDVPRVFLARVHDVETRRVLEDRLPLLVESRKVVVYGPCGVTTLAIR